jgi:hypothetical protein
MNIIPPRALKSFYRNEPITGVIITVGAVNAVLGGVNAIGSLLIWGLLLSGGAIAYRWWMIQRVAAKSMDVDRRLYLPQARTSSWETPGAYDRHDDERSRSRSKERL